MADELIDEPVDNNPFRRRSGAAPAGDTNPFRRGNAPTAQVAPAAPETLEPAPGADEDPLQRGRRELAARFKDVPILGTVLSTLQGLPENPVAAPIAAAVQETGRQLQEPEARRALLRAGGAMAAGALSIPGGPAAVIGGTAAGSVAGGYLANAIDAAENYLSGAPQPGFLESQSRVATDALIDTGITAGTIGLTTGAQALLGRLLRLPANARAALEEAQREGLEIGAANVAPSGVAGGSINVFSRMPIIGTPSKRIMQAQAVALAESRDRLLGQAAADVSIPEMGVQAYRTAVTRFDAMAQRANTMFRNATELADRTTRATVNTGPTIAAARELEREVGRVVPLATGEVMEGSIPTAVRELVEEAVALPPQIRAIEARTLDLKLERLMQTIKTQQGVSFGGLSQLRNANWASMEAAAGSDPAARALIRANNFYNRMMGRFEAVGAKQTVGRVTRGAFERGIERPGNLTEEAVMTTLNRLNSPQAVREFRRVGGAEPVRVAARQRVAAAFDNAVSQDPGILTFGQRVNFNRESFEAALGIGAPNSVEAATTRELLRGSGLDIGDLATLGRNAERVANVPIADASTFTARRAVLGGGSGGISGGIRSALTAATAGSGFAGGAAGVPGLAETTLLIIAARKGLRWAVEPELLRYATRSMNERLPVAVRNAAVLQLARGVGLTEADVEETVRQPTGGGQAQRFGPEGPTGFAPEITEYDRQVIEGVTSLPHRAVQNYVPGPRESTNVEDRRVPELERLRTGIREMEQRKMRRELGLPD